MVAAITGRFYKLPSAAMESKRDAAKAGSHQATLQEFHTAADETVIGDPSSGEAVHGPDMVAERVALHRHLLDLVRREEATRSGRRHEGPRQRSAVGRP